MNFLYVLTIIFVIMKVGGGNAVAEWDWLWIFSPLWLPWAFIILLGIWTVDKR